MCLHSSSGKKNALMCKWKGIAPLLQDWLVGCPQQRSQKPRYFKLQAVWQTSLPRKKENLTVRFYKAPVWIPLCESYHIVFPLKVIILINWEILRKYKLFSSVFFPNGNYIIYFYSFYSSYHHYFSKFQCNKEWKLWCRVVGFKDRPK